MSISKTQLANEMFEQNLWWSYSIEDGQEVIKLSERLEKLLGRPVFILEEIIGSCETPVLRIKVSEALESTDEDMDIRFVASYDTLKGKSSFQHQLRVVEVDGHKTVWAICLDVSEMVALEREIVDAQGRLSIAKMQEREALLQEQHQVLSTSYDKQSRFLAFLSHELRSPLLGISSLVKRLRSQIDGPEEVLNMLKAINMTAQQSTYLVNDILTYSQTEYDGIKLHPSRVSLTELLNNVKQLTKSIAADKNLIISLVYTGEHDEVLVDSVRLTQVLINLIVNAIKFTQFGGVNIEVKENQESEFVFTITDSGEGIAEDKIEKIFEPFAQIENKEGEGAYNTRYLGAGLGLFVVQQLVTLMGGKINVTSEVGVGASFQFSLNLSVYESDKISQKNAVEDVSNSHLPGKKSTVKVNESKQNTDTLDAVKSGHESYKVLIADDSSINRMVLAGYLENSKYEIVEAKDGREAWELFKEQAFDYVLLDIQMPFMDGIQVSKKINEIYKSSANSHLKGVFAITAGGEATDFISDNETTEEMGFDEWLVKPVSKNQIIQLLQKDYRNAQATTSSYSVEYKKSLDMKTLIEDVEEDNLLQMSEELPTIDDIPEQFFDLIEPFITEMQKSLKELDTLNKNAELDLIKKKAHYLKGNCMLFQLTGLVNLFKAIENLQSQTETSSSNGVYREQKTSELLKIIITGLKSLEKSVNISHNRE